MQVYTHLSLIHIWRRLRQISRPASHMLSDRTTLQLSLIPVSYTHLDVYKRQEVENVKALGVKIETNVVIGKSVKIDELMELSLIHI